MRFQSTVLRVSSVLFMVTAFAFSPLTAYCDEITFKKVIQQDESSLFEAIENRNNQEYFAVEYGNENIRAKGSRSMEESVAEAADAAVVGTVILVGLAIYLVSKTDTP